MNKKEALEYLELTIEASADEIQKRIREKIDYFNNLSENAPSDFLRRLNKQNLIKVQAIREESIYWNQPNSQSFVDIKIDEEEIPPLEIEELEVEKPFTKPVIIISTKDESVKPVLIEPLAWLIRHTENTSMKLFPLFPGKYYLGRKNEIADKNFILIEDDPYISRIHACIIVEKSYENLFYIEDSDEVNLGKQSKNGTFVNGNPERIKMKKSLGANDTIQIGITKMVLKLNTNLRVEEAIEDVKKSKFMHTVVIKNL